MSVGWKSLVVLAALAGCAGGRSESAVAALAEIPQGRKFNGVMLVADGDRVVSAEVVGLADRERGIALVRKSRFVIGSLAKQMTAALVLRLVEAGRVDLDRAIGEYLPPVIEWPGGVTTRHLLTHTSGMVALGEPLAAEPGSTFAYSNVGYGILGRMLEHVEGEPFAEILAELAARCAMPDTATIQVRNTIVHGYEERSDGTFQGVDVGLHKEHPASGGVVSTADDLVRWNVCLHEGGVLRPETYAAMVQPVAERSHRWGTLGYGFGLQVSSKDGLLEYSHSGYVEGFIATLLYYPATRRTVVLLENVSPLADDMERVFAPHDRVRAVERARLLARP